MGNVIIKRKIFRVPDGGGDRRRREMLIATSSSPAVRAWRTSKLENWCGYNALVDDRRRNC